MSAITIRFDEGQLARLIRAIEGKTAASSETATADRYADILARVRTSREETEARVDAARQKGGAA